MSRYYLKDSIAISIFEKYGLDVDIDEKAVQVMINLADVLRARVICVILIYELSSCCSPVTSALPV